MLATSDKKNKQLSRESWVLAAFDTLYKDGIDAVRIEPLAKKMNVTKGSFYWHFKNRTELHDALLEYWEKEMTQSVLDAANEFHGSPKQRLINTLRDIIGNERTKYDPFVRNWARNDTKVRKVVEYIDKIRLSFLHGLFIDIGFDKQEAEIRSRLMYYYICGECTVSVKEPMTKRMKRLDIKAEIMMQPLARK
ncbi:MAG: TetR/AcrR family transcriptional regulator [Proteobacteria bacterium]|nr:TetR/AcrR family transcriptional regulator [Pseudomonadota bacterium]NOG59588.1 TetR/AcrR family transcriptional regulator [Pseudomonadota bacterium]